MKTDRVEFYRDEGKKWRWRFVQKNSRVLADSGEGYTRRIDAVNGCARVTFRNPVLDPEKTPAEGEVRAVIVDD